IYSLRFWTPLRSLCESGAPIQFESVPLEAPMLTTPKAIISHFCHRAIVVVFAVVVVMLMVIPYASGQNFTILYSFKGLPDDGWGPLSGVVLDASGNLYGT